MATPHQTPDRILAVGEVLFDHFPGGKRLGGAPCNFAVHARGLGMDAQLLTRVGDDDHGNCIQAKLVAFGFHPRLLQVDPHTPTGAVHVSFSDSGDPAYAIRPAAWDHIGLDPALTTWLKDFSPQMLYFGSLVQRTPTGAGLIEELATHFNRTSTFLCDLNLRRGNVVRDRVIRCLELCHILKLNREELDYLCRTLDLSGTPRECMERISSRFTISLVALTRGKSGSILFSESGFTESAGTIVSDPVNTVGAGDAFCAALAQGALHNENPEQMLERAGRLAAAVCRLPGAVPENSDFYRKFISKSSAKE